MILLKQAGSPSSTRAAAVSQSSFAGFCTGYVMEQDILAEIFAAEKEVQERLAAEQRSSEELLARVKGEIAEQLAVAEEGLQVESEKVLADAREAAAKRAAALLKEAVSQAERLDRISDEALQEVVAKRLTGILPEEQS